MTDKHVTCCVTYESYSMSVLQSLVVVEQMVCQVEVDGIQKRKAELKQLEEKQRRLTATAEEAKNIDNLDDLLTSASQVPPSPTHDLIPTNHKQSVGSAFLNMQM